MKFRLRNVATAVACLAVAMFATSCGGNANKKQSADTATETATGAATETKAPARILDEGWESNDFTAQVPKPDIAIRSAGERGSTYGVNFNSATLEQVKAYAAKLRAAGFDRNVSETDAESYSFSAENAAGWNVYTRWGDGQSGVMISKPR
jgi:hypothetical protein